MYHKYYFIYSNYEKIFKYFKTYRDAEWFAHNEGDHLIEWGKA